MGDTTERRVTCTGCAPLTSKESYAQLWSIASAAAVTRTTVLLVFPIAVAADEMAFGSRLGCSAGHPLDIQQVLIAHAHARDVATAEIRTITARIHCYLTLTMTLPFARPFST